MGADAMNFQKGLFSPYSEEILAQDRLKYSKTLRTAEATCEKAVYTLNCLRKEQSLLMYSARKEARWDDFYRHWWHREKYRRMILNHPALHQSEIPYLRKRLHKLHRRQNMAFKETLSELDVKWRQMQ